MRKGLLRVVFVFLAVLIAGANSAFAPTPPAKPLRSISLGGVVSITLKENPSPVKGIAWFSVAIDLGKDEHPLWADLLLSGVEPVMICSDKVVVTDTTSNMSSMCVMLTDAGLLLAPSLLEAEPPGIIWVSPVSVDVSYACNIWGFGGSEPVFSTSLETAQKEAAVFLKEGKKENKLCSPG